MSVHDLLSTGLIPNEADVQICYAILPKSVVPMQDLLQHESAVCIRNMRDTCPTRRAHVVCSDVAMLDMPCMYMRRRSGDAGLIS